MASEWWAQARCSRKRRYSSYAQAKQIKQRMALQGSDVSYLVVYKCDQGDHYHLGNVRGGIAKQRVDKRLRRKEKHRNDDY